MAGFLDLLGNLGGIAGGYQSMQERLQRQQYNQLLMGLNAQALQQRIADQNLRGDIFRAYNQLGAQVPTQPTVSPPTGTGPNFASFWGGQGFQQPNFGTSDSTTAPTPPSLDLPGVPSYAGGDFGAQPQPYAPSTGAVDGTGFGSGLPSNQLQLAHSLINAGYPPAAAAGIVGSMTGESGSNLATGWQDQGRTLGIANWLGPRQQALLNRPDPLSLGTQTQFTIDELSGRGGDTGAAAMGTRMRTETDPAQAARDFTLGFERPSASEAASSLPQREAAARQVYAQLNSSATPQDRIAGAYGVRNTFAQVPQLPAALPRLDLHRVAQAISDANPQASDNEKGATLLAMYPLLSAEAKDQATEAWKRYEAEFGQYKFGVEQEEKATEFRQKQEDLEAQRAWTRTYQAGLLGTRRDPANETVGAPVEVEPGADGKPRYVQQYADGSWRPIPGIPASVARKETPAPARYGTVDYIMQKWHDDYVKQNGREPSDQEVEQKRADVVQTERPPGQVVQNVAERIMIAGNDVAKTLDALAALPGGTTLGIFGGAQAALGPDLGDNVKRALANAATPESSQLLATFARGVGRSLAMLISAGAGQGVQTLAEQLKGDLPEANDKGLTIAAKMADIRQISEAALEVLQTDRRLSTPQQGKITEILDRIHRAVPFTTTDTAKLANPENTERFTEFAKKLGLGGGGRAGVDAASIRGMSRDQVIDELAHYRSKASITPDDQKIIDALTARIHQLEQSAAPGAASSSTVAPPVR